MTVDADPLAGLNPAMVVVTTAVDGDADGCLVGFHSQSSIDPLHYAVWLSVQNRTYRLAVTATHLAVHLLGAGDRDLAELFGGTTGDEVDKLAGVEWEPGPGGVPVLARVERHVVGHILRRHVPAGDHAGFELEVVQTRGSADGSWRPLRLADVSDIRPGHEA